MRLNLSDLLIFDIYRKEMIPALHKILLELENKVIDTDNYFKWSEDEKEALVFYIGKCFSPVIERGEKHKLLLMATLWNIIQEAEYHDEFEHADILNRCLIHLEEGHW